MSFNYLPDHIVIQILTQLDDQAKFRAMSVFERWAEIFGSTSKFINGFTLKIDSDIVNECELEDLPNIPIKNVTISNIYNLALRVVSRIYGMLILKKYENSVNTIAIQGSEFSAYDLAEILGFKNLEHLKLIDVEIRAIGFYKKCHLTTPTIKSLEIEADHKEVNKTLDLFNHCASVKKLSLRYRKSDDEDSDDEFDRDILLGFIKSLPKLNHFVFWKNEIEINDAVFTEDFPAKLEKLEIDHLSDDTDEDIAFFRSQNDTMKELIIHDDDEEYMEFHSDILEFILTEMNLKYFQFGDIKMIVDYERQPESFLHVD